MGTYTIRSVTQQTITQRIRDVRGRIARACLRAGRPPEEITLLAVSKGHSADAVREATDAGVAHIGESYVQEWAAKRAALPGDIRWHFIGHLQSNKVRDVVGNVSLIHGVDRASLVRAIEKHAAAPQALLLQVNLGGETTKSGCPPAELPALLDTVLDSPTLRPVGLMTIPPPVEDPEEARPQFRILRTLGEELRSRIARKDEWMAGQFSHLSMGMSHDLEVAIEEGATIVRVGTDIFGPRT